MENSKETRELRPSFSKSPKLPKYPKICVTESSNSLYTRATSHLIRNVELDTLDSFCVSVPRI